MSTTPSTEAKAPARPAREILADIARERAELSRSFEALRRDMSETLDAGRDRAFEAGRKAAIVAPIAGAVVALAVVAALVLRRRSGRAG